MSNDWTKQDFTVLYIHTLFCMTQPRMFAALNCTCCCGSPDQGMQKMLSSQSKHGLPYQTLRLQRDTSASPGRQGQGVLAGDCFALLGEPLGCDPKSPPTTSAITASTIAPVSCRVMLVDLRGFPAPLRGLGGRPPPFRGLGGRPLGSGEPERCLGCQAAPSYASERGLEGRPASMLGVCWLLSS